MALLNFVYRNLGNGRRYLVLGKGKMKHPVTREWVPSVRYVCIEGDTAIEEYHREEEDFNVKFEMAQVERGPR